MSASTKIKLFALFTSAMLMAPGVAFAGTMAVGDHETVKPTESSVAETKKSGSTTLGDVVDAVKGKTKEVEQGFWNRFHRLYLRFEGAKRKYTHKIEGFSNSPNTASVTGIGIGYHRIERPIDFEFKTEWHKDFQVNEGFRTLKAKSRVYMINMYYNIHWPKNWTKKIPLVERVVPYFMGGVGMAEYDDTIDQSVRDGIPRPPSIYKNKKTYAWNAGFGLKFKIIKEVLADFGYRYASLGEIFVDDSGSTSKVRGHQAIAAVIFNF